MIQCGISPQYILDEMQQYEMKILVDNIKLKDRESWEQTRMLSYITAQVNSTKKLKVNDIMQFPWDEETETTTHNTTISNSDIERLRERAKNYLKKKQE